MASILLVEDEELTRKAISYILTAKGYEVLEASDGKEGVELFAQQPDAIDLVLSDIRMPRMSGLEMLQILKHMRPQVKQILITAVPIDAQAWREYGAHDWLTKPFATEQLLGKVADALAV